MAISAEHKQKVKKLIQLGQAQGYLTQEDVLNEFPQVEDDLQLLEYVVAKLQDSEIEIIQMGEVQDEAVAGGSSKLSFEEKIAILKRIRSHVSTDPMRAYLHEIGKIPLLNAEEEVVLAKRIEAGELEKFKLIRKLAEDTTKPAYVDAIKVLNDISDDISTRSDKRM